MFTKLPADLTGLSNEDLVALKATIKAEAKAFYEANKGVVPAESAADVTEVLAAIDTIKATLAQRAEDQAAFQANADRLAALADEDDTDTSGDDTDDDTDDETDTDDDDDTDASTTPSHLSTVKTGFGMTKANVPPAPKADQTKQVTPFGFQAADGVAGKKAGDRFENWTEVATAMQDLAGDLVDATRKYTIGIARATYAPGAAFSEDAAQNVQLLRATQDDEVRAALCAPATPHYELGCQNTDRRPVFGSLPKFAAPRGAVSIYPSPSFDSIDTGFGIWTDADDTNPSSTKTCETIDCANSETYKIYGVYRCLTVKNLTMLTFPELVGAYLNRLAAQQARLAENQILNAMSARAEFLLTPPLIYGGSVSITSQLMHILALHQERERWDTDAVAWDAWVPRWVRTAMKIDILRRRNDNGGAPSIVSDSTIDAMFTNVGVNPVWFLDRPTWMTTVPPVQQASTLRKLPELVDMIIAPRGKFAMMDRGELKVGVTGDNIYRDRTANSKNEFSFFFESFEGLVDSGCEKAYRVRFPACWTGQQIADLAADCDATRVGS